MFIERMRTVFESDWLSYLTKSTQTKDNLDEPVSPDVQLIVGEKDGAKGAKRKRRGELPRPSKVLKKGGGSASQIVDLEAGGSSPPPKGGRTLWVRPINL
ncbi:hypothetical protein A2U01_0058861, partial [Trifolium medium]|nr:hypothetical protein [Trifolium medium]